MSGAWFFGKITMWGWVQAAQTWWALRGFTTILQQADWVTEWGRDLTFLFAESQVQSITANMKAALSSAFWARQEFRFVHSARAAGFEACLVFASRSCIRFMRLNFETLSNNYWAVSEFKRGASSVASTIAFTSHSHPACNDQVYSNGLGNQHIQSTLYSYCSQSDIHATGGAACRA